MGLKSKGGHFIGTIGANKFSGLLKLNIQLFSSKFTVPNTPKIINPEKQARHINGEAGKSQLSINMDECKELLKKFSGKGIMVNSNQEKVNFERIIGYIETPNGLVPTTWGKIHYSKTGAHIVPYYQKN